MPGDSLCLLTIHAHPDDEASKGAPTCARYAAEGVRTVLVCCTGGEEGDIHNPAMDRPEVRDRLAEVRAAELTRSGEVIGFSEVVMLGYRDSGMPESPANEHPESFHQADLDEAVGRLVAVIRRERPQVIVTYNDDQQGYPHPDHLKVHDITIPAWERSGDPAWYPEAGEPWTPLKLYYTVWSRARMLAVHQAMLALKGSSPFDEKWFERPSQDHRITTKVDVHDFVWARTQSLLAHATQIDPEGPWFSVPLEIHRRAWPTEDYQLVRSAVATDLPEDDLFAGVVDPVAGLVGDPSEPADASRVPT
jgi:mycothiol S-conjugate amidase